MTDTTIDEVQVLVTGTLQVRVRSGTRVSIPLDAHGGLPAVLPAPLSDLHRQPLVSRHVRCA